MTAAMRHQESAAQGYSSELLEGAVPEAAIGGLSALLGEDAICDQVLGYHGFDYQSGMTEILGDRLRHLVLKDPSGSITGYLPFREQAGPSGTIVNALPFFGPNGLIAARSDAALKHLLAAFAQAVRRPEVLSAVVYTPFRADPELIAAALEPDFRLPRLTQYLDLAGGAPWPSVRRWDIAKAERAGFGIRRSTPGDIAPLYEIYREGCAAVGIPVKPPAYFHLTQRLGEDAEHLGRADGPLWLTAELAGDAVAGLLVMRGRHTASYTIPIASAAVRARQPLALLIDAAVGYCRRDGQRYFNFESSPEVGGPVYRFKERWGAETSRYEVQGIFPNGTRRLHALSRAEIARAYPFYFAYPFAPPPASCET